MGMQPHANSAPPGKLTSGGEKARRTAIQRMAAPLGPSPFAGITRIRFKGFRQRPISAPQPAAHPLEQRSQCDSVWRPRKPLTIHYLICKKTAAAMVTIEADPTAAANGVNELSRQLVSCQLFRQSHHRAGSQLCCRADSRMGTAVPSRTRHPSGKESPASFRLGQ